MSVNVHAHFSQCFQAHKTYFDSAGVLAIKADNRLTARVKLDAVLRSKPGDDLDTICRHGRGSGCRVRLQASRCNEAKTSPSGRGNYLVRCWGGSEEHANASYTHRHAYTREPPRRITPQQCGYSQGAAGLWLSKFRDRLRCQTTGGQRGCRRRG